VLLRCGAPRYRLPMLSAALTLLTLSQAALPTAPNQDPDALFAAASVEVDGERCEYRLLTPAEPIEGKRYPLILFLHGSGERGSDNTKQLTHFPRRMATPERRAEFPCFVLAPQCPSDGRWTHDTWGSRVSQRFADEPTDAMKGAIAALLAVVREHPVDVDRIYLTGLSMGGYGAFELALRHPDWFAAVAPVCGGGDEQRAARLAGLPLSVWHGDADSSVPVARSRAMVAALRELGEAPEYHELPGVGHDAWNHAYADGGCLPWLFAARRDPEARLAAATRLLAAALPEDARVAFLGDSITQAGAEPGGYVDRLRQALATERPGVTVVPAGITGNRVPDLLGRYERDVLAHTPTHVFVYIGINDVWHSENGRGTPRGEFASGLTTLCEALERAGARVALATASVIGERRHGTNPLDGMLDDYVGVTREVAAEGRKAGRTLCDLRAAFLGRLALANRADVERGVLTSDGVHLNAAGEVLVATEAARALREASLVEVRRR